MASVHRAFIDRGSSADVAKQCPEPDENQLVRFTIPVSITTDGGVWRGVDPSQAPIKELASTVIGLWTLLHEGKPLAVARIVWYRSAIADIHQGYL